MTQPLITKFKGDVINNEAVLNKATRMLLCCNGEHYTAWRVRLDIVNRHCAISAEKSQDQPGQTEDVIQYLVDELHFNHLICVKF